MTNLNTTFNIRSFYNFWIQDSPEYKNDKRSRATESLNDIHDSFDVYLSSLQKNIFVELLIYEKNRIWHPKLFNPTTLNSFQQSLNKNFIRFKLKNGRKN